MAVAACVLLAALALGWQLSRMPRADPGPAAVRASALTLVEVARYPTPADAGSLLGVSDVQRALAVRGITSAEQLIAAIDRSDDLGAHGYMRPPPPRKSLSALYSDVEVLDTVATDTIIVDIPTTAGQVTTSITLAQMPMKWSFGDLTFDGDVASPGSTKKIEIRVILGTRTITKFRLSQLSRTTDSASVLDALQKVYDYEIGPNSTVKIEIENMNPNAIETFTNGFFQYVYHPVIDAEASRIIRGR